MCATGTVSNSDEDQVHYQVLDVCSDVPGAVMAIFQDMGLHQVNLQENNLKIIKNTIKESHFAEVACPTRFIRKSCCTQGYEATLWKTVQVPMQN